MYNGNLQQNPLCVESCVTKEFSISLRLSRTIFDPDANSVFFRAHLCTAVGSMRRKPCVRNCSRKREGRYSGIVQQNPLCAASCVTKDILMYPRFSPTIFYRGPVRRLRGRGDVTNLSPFWEETAQKQPLPGTYLTNPLVKCDEFEASLPTM